MKNYQKAALEDIYELLGRLISEKIQELEEKPWLFRYTAGRCHYNGNPGGCNRNIRQYNGRYRRLTVDIRRYTVDSSGYNRRLPRYNRNHPAYKFNSLQYTVKSWRYNAGRLSCNGKRPLCSELVKFLP